MATPKQAFAQDVVFDMDGAVNADLSLDTLTVRSFNGTTDTTYQFDGDLTVTDGLLVRSGNFDGMGSGNTAQVQITVTGDLTRTGDGSGTSDPDLKTIFIDARGTGDAILTVGRDIAGGYGENGGAAIEFSDSTGVGNAVLVLNGSLDQLVYGSIDSRASDDSGEIRVENDTNTAIFYDDIGSYNDIRQITIGQSGGASGNAKFGSYVGAEKITISNGTASFEADVATTTIDVEAGQTATFDGFGYVSGSITGSGTVDIESGSDDRSFDRDLGTNSEALAAVNIGTADDDGNADFGGSIYATAITVGGGNAGTAVFDSYVNADIITITSGSASFADNVNTTTLDVKAGQTATFDGTNGVQEVNGAVTGDGTVHVQNDTTFKAGVSVGVAEIDPGKRARFQAGSGAIQFTGQGSGPDGRAIFENAGVAADQTITGAITTAVEGEGFVDINTSGQTVTFNQDIGAIDTGNAIERVLISEGDAIFQGSVAGTRGILLDGNTATFSGNADATVEGAITSNNRTGRGNAVIVDKGTGTITFKDDIGTSAQNVSAVTITSGTGDFDGDVFASTVDLDASSNFAGDVTATTLDIASGQTATFDEIGTVNGAVTGTGSVDVDGEHNFQGTLGDASGQTLSALNIGTNSPGAEAAFAERVDVDAILVGDAGASDGAEVLFENIVDADTITVENGLTGFQGAVTANSLTVKQKGGIAFLGSGTQTIDTAIDGGSNDAGDIAVFNGGTDVVVFNQEIGAGERVGVIQIGLDDTGVTGISGANGNAQFTQNVKATQIVVGDTSNASSPRVGTADFDGLVDAGTITITNGSANFAGNVNTQNGFEITFQQMVTFDGTSPQEVSGPVTGNGTAIIASDTMFKGEASVQLMQIQTGKTATFFESGTRVVEFVGGGTAVFTNSTQNVRETMTTTALGTGTVKVEGTTVTFDKDVGATGMGLNTVSVASGEGIFDGDVFATMVELQSKGDFNGNIEAMEIDLNASSNFAGNVTTASGLDVAAGRTATFDGTNVAQAVSGAVIGAGSIVVDNSNGVTFGGAIGTSVTSLNAVTITSGMGDFDGDVFASTVDLDASLSFAGNVSTTMLDIASGQTATFDGTNAAQEVSGAVTGEGSVVVNNSIGVTFGGGVGTSGTSLNAVTITSGTGDFDGNVFADTVDLNASSSFAGNVTTTTLDIDSGETATFDGTVSSQTVVGTVTGDGTVTVTNDKGVTFQQDVAVATTATGGTVTFEGNAAAVTVTGTGDSARFDAAGAQSVSGNITGDGGVVVTSRSTTVFNGDVTVSNEVLLDGSASFSGNLSAQELDIGSGRTATFNGTGGTKSVSGTVNGEGSVIVTVGDNDRVVFESNVGRPGSTSKLDTVTVTSGTAEFKGNVESVNGLVIGANTVAFANTNGGSVSAAITGTGTLQILENTTFNRSVASSTTAEVEADKIGSFESGAGAIEFIGDGTVSFTTNTQTVSGAVTTTAGAGTGTVDVDASGQVVTFNETLGVFGTGLKEISVSAGEGVFKKDVFADRVDIALGQTATFDGTNAAQAVSGAVTGAGSVVVDNSNGVTFGGAVGTSVTSLDAVTITSGTGEFTGDVFATTTTLDSTGDFNGAISSGTIDLNASSSFAGDVTATTLDIDSGETATFDGINAAQEVSGTVTGEGSVFVNNSNGVTFNNDIGASGSSLNAVTVGDGTGASSASFLGGVFAKTIEVAQNAVAVFSQAFSADTTKLANEVTVNGLDNEGGAFSTAANSKLKLGHLVDDGVTVFTVDSLDLGANTQVELDFSAGSLTGTGDVFTLFDGGTANISSEESDLSFVSPDGLLVQLGPSNTDVSKIVVGVFTINSDTFNTALGLNDEDSALNDAVFGAMTSGGELEGVLVPILNANNAGSREALEQLGAQKDTMTATSKVSVQTVQTNLDLASNRLTSQRGGVRAIAAAQSEKTGSIVGTDDGALAGSAWIKPFYNTMDQDERNGVDGFGADTAGVAFGADVEVSDESRVGIAGSWAASDVDGDGAGESQLDIDSYQVTLYGDYDFGVAYVEGFAGYAINQVDSQRVIDFGTLNPRTARASFDSQQSVLGALVGTNLSLSENLVVSPETSLTWTRVKTDDYTETGAGGVSQIVSVDDVDVVQASLGATLSAILPMESGTLVPQGFLGVGYDLAGDEAVATARFTGGGAAFEQTGAEVEQFSVNAGLGLTWEANAFSIGANYDAEYREDFLSHTGQVKLKIEF